MKYCCKKFDKYKNLGWLFAPDYYDNRWHINISSSGEVSYDKPIAHCPFCGNKLILDTAG